MAEVTAAKPRKMLNAKTIGLMLAPLILLAGVIALFLSTNGAGLQVQPAAPLESLTFDKTILRPGEIEINVRNTSIPVAAATAAPDAHTLMSFTLIGLYAGVIPVLLGITWFPALRLAGPRTFIFLMAMTVGLLIYLGIDAANEALQQAGPVGGPFQGVGLVGIGIVVTFMLLDAITRWQVGIGRGEAAQRLTLALMISVDIGLHNLGEGLAIGASFSVGAAALGTFLVIGFILKNITEGLGILAPVIKDQPSWRRLAVMGLIGGGPAIVGAWVGGFTYSQPLAVLFLAVGAGAVLEVAYEVFKFIRVSGAKNPRPLTVFSGVTAGMLLLYVTGFFIK